MKSPQDIDFADWHAFCVEGNETQLQEAPSMKNNWTIKILAAAALVVGGQAQAYNVDTLMCTYDGKSGEPFELAAMQTCVNTFWAADNTANTPGTAPTVDFDDRWNQEDTGFNIQQDGSGNWYIDVDPSQPGFFSIKFGGGNFPDVDSTYFFQNLAELTKLVFTEAQVNYLIGGCGDRSCNEGRLSHYSIFNDEPNRTPEPASLALLGLGLAGLALFGRRRRR